MRGIELRPEEKLIKKSGRTTYITSRVGGPQGMVYLTNQRMIFCKVNIISVVMFGASTRFLKGKMVLEIPLTNINSVSRTKIQLSNNILVISTNDGSEYKFDLKFNIWSQEILEALRHQQVKVTMVDENKWSVQRN